jgi:hypothetical protein
MRKEGFAFFFLFRIAFCGPLTAGLLSEVVSDGSHAGSDLYHTR